MKDLYSLTMQRGIAIFCVLALTAVCANAHTLTSLQTMGTDATVGAGGVIYQGCELCTEGNYIAAVPAAGSGVMLFNADGIGQIGTDIEDADIVTSLAAEIPDINQIVCAKDVVMAVGVSGSDLKVHFARLNAGALVAVDIVFDNTVNSAAANHVVASAKSTNAFVACGTESSAGVWRCALFDVASDGLTVSRYDFEGTYEAGKYVIPGLSFDGLTLVIADLTEGGVHAYGRKITTVNMTKIGLTSTAGQDVFVTAVDGDGALVPRLQYHRKSLSFVGMYAPDSGTAVKMYAIRLTAVPGNRGVADVEIDANTWVDATTVTELPRDFYINRYGNDLIGLYHDGTNTLLTSNLIENLGHAGIGLDQTSGDIETETDYHRVIEMCPILGNDSYVWATAGADDDVVAFTYTGTYFHKPTIDSITPGETVSDIFIGDSSMLVNSTLTINWTIAEVGTDSRTRISFIPIEQGENHADGYDITKYVELSTATAGTYSVTLDVSDISAANPEGLTVAASSAYKNITAGVWSVIVGIKKASFENRNSDASLIIVIDDTTHSLTHSPASAGIGYKDLSGDLVNAANVQAVCQSSDSSRLYVVETGVGIHEYSIDLEATHREHVFAFVHTMEVAFAFTTAECIYEDNVILLANREYIQAYGYNATTGLYDIHHTVALNLTANSVTLDGGFTVHRVSATVARIFFYTYPSPTTHPTRAVLVDQTFNPTTGAFVGTPDVDTYQGFTPGVPTIFIDTESDSQAIREIMVNDTSTGTIISYTFASQVPARQTHADFVPGFDKQSRWHHGDHSGTFANDVLSLPGGLGGVTHHGGLGNCGDNGVLTPDCTLANNSQLTLSVGKIGRVVVYNDKISVYQIKPKTIPGMGLDHYQHIRTIYTVSSVNPNKLSDDAMACACHCGHFAPLELLDSDFSSNKNPFVSGNSVFLPFSGGFITVTAHSKDFVSSEFIGVQVACENPQQYNGLWAPTTCTGDFANVCGNNFTTNLHTLSASNVGIGLGSSKNTAYKTLEALNKMSKTSVVATSTGACNISDTLNTGSFSHDKGNLYVVGADGNLYFGGCVAHKEDPHNDRDFFTKYFAMILLICVMGVGIAGSVAVYKSIRVGGYVGY